MPIYILRFFLGAVLPLLLCLFSSLPIVAQNNNTTTVTISGYIKDADNLETLIGANILVPALNIGTVTNIYGYYAIKVPQGSEELTLSISFIGYQTITRTIVPSQDVSLSADLDAESEVLTEIVITENANRQLIENTQMGTQKITSQSLKSIPVILGEADVLKVVQLTAGVQTGSEGTSGFYVRGGGNDQNLILLDEATVYNPEHFFGFFSTFNSDIIKNLEIYKSDFPAKYGGRASSVLDIQMREGNMKRFAGQGGIGLVASRLTLEGPIQKNRSSFVISGRRTYLDIFKGVFDNIAENNANEDGEVIPVPAYYFYDLNTKANYIINDNNRIYLSGYFGRDKLDFQFDGGSENSSSYKLNWGNITGTLRWNHIFNPDLFSNTSLIVSRFDYKDEFQFDDIFSFSSSSQTYNYSLKQDFSFLPHKNHRLDFGAHYTHHIIRPIELDAGTETSSFGESQKYTGEEIAAYVEDNWSISRKLSMKAGFRFSGFLTTDNKFWSAPEPRLAFNYQLNERTAIKASYARMAQYLHQVKFSPLSFLDAWFPSNKNIAPQLSDQVSVGWNRLFFNDQISISNEYYYKWLYNQLEYQNGAAFLFINENYHERLAVGKGYSYGTEVQIEKKKGKFTGWLSYTLSWSFRDFPDLNNGEIFPFTYDRRHVINLVTQYRLPRNWSLSANWTYRTGVATDLAVGRYFLYGINFSNPTVVPVYTEVNNFRMPPYHRFDIGAIKEFRTDKKVQTELVFSVYNVYNRRNPFFIYYDDLVNEETGEVKFVSKLASLFPVIPSVSFNASF